MKRRLVAAFAVMCLLCCRTARAHRIDEYLQATLLSLEGDRVEASMRLIPGILVSPGVIAGIDRNGDGVFSDGEERAYAERVLRELLVSVDGRRVAPKLLSWTFPQPAQLRDGLGEIHLAWSAALPPGGAHRALVVEDHHLNRTSVYLMNATVPEVPGLRIVGQRRSSDQSRYEVDYDQLSGAGVGSPSAWEEFREGLGGAQFRSLFELGVRHIAEGTDHLLFLLALLIPAPLLAVRGRWAQPGGVRYSLVHILRIVTAFTLGHSITLSLAAMNVVRVPGRPVEVLIAVSIFVSALHAMRPIFPGREAWSAAFFGLIHGLAFAATLDRLGLGRWERAGGILSFNLGIEAMQMVAVAAVLPSLMVLSRTRAYTPFRAGAACFAAVAALGWMVERTFGVETPVDAILNRLARHAVWVAVVLFGVSVACWILLRPVWGRERLLQESGAGVVGGSAMQEV